MKKKQQIIGAVVIGVLIAGASFWGGMSYAKSQVPSRGSFIGAGQFGGATTGAAGRAGFARTGTGGFGGAAMGQIVSNSGTSISVKLANGSTELVLLNSSTQVEKTVSGSATDLSQGANVLVTGQSNSDGSVTAQMIQIRPATTTRM